MTEKLFNLSAYGMAIPGIALNFDNIKGAILFVGAVTLLVLQIKLHIIKIRNEKK